MSGGHGRVSVVVLARDEERCVARCLDSVVGRGFDDVLVVDTGSTDGTTAIVDGYRDRGVRRVSVPWPDSFADARNTALDLVGAGWVVFLDADEWVADRSAGDLAARLAGVPDQAGVAVAPIIADADTGDFVDDVPRMFRADSGIRYRGAVHEYPVRGDGGPVALLRLDVEFRHDGYSPAVLAAKRKAERNLALLRRARAEDPDNPRWLYFVVRNPLSVVGDVDIEGLCEAIGLLADRGVGSGDHRSAREYHRRALAVACQGLALRGDWAAVERCCARMDRHDRGESPDAHYFRVLNGLVGGVLTEHDLRQVMAVRQDDEVVARSTVCPAGRHLDAVLVALLERGRGTGAARRYRELCDPWTDVFFDRSELRVEFTSRTLG